MFRQNERSARGSGAPYVLPGEVCLTANNMKSLLVWINDTLERKELDWMLAGNDHFAPIFTVLSTVNERLMWTMMEKKKAKIDVQVDINTNSNSGSNEKVETAEEREQPGVTQIPLRPAMRSTFTLSEFHSFIDWLESELAKLASDVENQSSPLAPAAMNLMKYLYRDARKAVSERQNFVVTFEARYEARSIGPYMVRAQVQSPQQPTNNCVLLR